MRSSFLVVAGCLALLVTWDRVGVAVNASTDPVVRTGRYYELVSHLDDPEAAEQALAIVEATWPVAMSTYGIPGDPPDEPLAIHLYRDPAGYEAAEAELTRGRFKRNLAFAHWDTKTAHVALQPQLSADIVRDHGLNYQTLRLLVHEAAHLARFHALSNYRSHPGWFSDGNASWIETEVLREQGLFTTPEQDPSFSTHVLRVQRLLRDDELPAMRDILHDDTDDLEFYEVYAARWMVFRFLVQGDRKRALQKTIADMRRFGGGSGFVERVAKALSKRLRDADFAKLERDFRAWVDDLEPQWNEIYPSLETVGDTWMHTAFDSVNAISWRTEPAGDGGFELTGTLEILDDGKNQLNLLLGREESGFVTVALSPGRVDVFDYSIDDDRWTRLAESDRAQSSLGEPFGFRVRWTPGRELSVDIEGRQVVELETERSFAGPWGLGAQAGSSGLWRDVRLQR